MLKRTLITFFFIISIGAITSFIFRDRLIISLLKFGANLSGLSIERLEDIRFSNNNILIKSITGSFGASGTLKASELEFQMGWPLFISASAEKVNLTVSDFTTSESPASPRSWLYFAPVMKIKTLDLTLVSSISSNVIFSDLIGVKDESGLKVSGNFSSELSPLISPVSLVKLNTETFVNGNFEAVVPKTSESISTKGSFITSETTLTASPYTFHSLKSKGDFSYKESTFAITADATSDLASGPIQLKNLSGTLAWESAKGMTLKNLQVKTFGGKALIKTFEFDKSFKPFVLTFSDFDLSEILSAYAQEGIKGQGKFSGAISVESKATLPLITEGSFASNESGFIKVDPSKVALPANAGTSVVKRALEDFQFLSISGTLSSDQNGSVAIKATFTGESPKVGPGQPIVLNLTIEENIPKLIESLKLLNQASKGELDF